MPDEVQAGESQQANCSSSVEEDDFLQQQTKVGWGDLGKKSYTIDLLCHGKGPTKQGAEQSNADASAVKVSQSKRGCDDPLADKGGRHCFEPKSPDSTLLNVSLFGLVAAVGRIFFVKKMKKE